MASRRAVPMEEKQAKLRGHRFLPSHSERARIPGRYGQESVAAADKVAYVHYFGGRIDFWACELWQDEEDLGQWWAFGYTRLSNDPQGAEWGYQNLNELEAFRASGRGLPVWIERDLYWEPTPMWKIERSGVFDSHGYDYIVMYGRHRGWKQSQIAELCRKAHQDSAPADAALLSDGVWWTAAETPARLRSLFGLPDRVPADDVDLDRLGFPYLVAYQRARGNPPAFISKMCQEAARIGASPDTYDLGFRQRQWFTISNAPSQVRQLLGLSDEPDPQPATSPPKEAP